VNCTNKGQTGCVFQRKSVTQCEWHIECHWKAAG